ncbi:hypothetical protein FVE85_6650 [Porphyridium purpureum]|uniref:SRPBCC domain-containing protein n=1 Tax=Porphyridium purpureum TaxID=35688 RepID=A0A5J4Z6W2_PORPP|nr:hypothetical protein FVE85_6650 [Porphyridium purpureum]|eukprot:POR2571..scf295_1
MVASVETEIEVAAPPEVVWKRLMDFGSYAAESWNPMLLRVEGEARLGSTLSVDVKQPEMSMMTFTPVVVTMDPMHEFAWNGKLFFPGLFDGEHRFKLVPSADGQHTTFFHSESFSGLLVYLFFSESMRANITKGFESMNEALKKRCESGNE